MRGDALMNGGLIGFGLGFIAASLALQRVVSEFIPQYATLWHFRGVVIIGGIGLAIGIGFILVLLLVGGLLFGIGFAIYLVSMTALYFYAGIFGLAFIIFILILGGIVNTFTSSIYTLVYLELSKRQKLT